MPIRLSGLASGLDTEALVGALVSAYSYKKDKYVKAQTKLSWKQDAWKTLTVEEHMKYYLDRDLNEKEAMKAVAKDRGVSRREIYRIWKDI